MMEQLRYYSAVCLDEERSPYLGQLVFRPTCESGILLCMLQESCHSVTMFSFFFLLLSTQGPNHRRENTCVSLTISLNAAEVTG